MDTPKNENNMDNIIDIPNQQGQPTGNRIDLSERLVVISGAIDENLATEIMTSLPLLDQLRDKPIFFKINSPGGALYDCQAIIAEITRCENEVITDITGVAYSAAAMIALAGDRVRMSRFGQMMLHYPSWESDSVALGQHKIDTKSTEEYFDRMIKELIKRSKLDYRKFKAAMLKTDMYYTPAQALKNGLVDEVY